ncbi:MAG TPA: MXAN_5187 family protein [Polyangiaceae bacterium]|nr:MXAN_5187 family protein [Polyangiaceae bacterium]
MLLSRFWYVVLAVALGAVLFALFLSTSMYDRASVRAMGEALAADSQVVGSFLRDDARRRASALIVPVLDDDIRTHLAKASASVDKIPNDSKEKVRAALRKHFNNAPADQKFDALFALDQSGRVVGEVGFDQSSSIEGFELGGFPVVADALHGWVRDDTWVLGGRIYRVVARPVEHDVSQMPAGAIVGVRILDDTFARELSRRTSAAIAFYANGARVSSGAPEGFDATQLDTVTAELKSVEADANYKEKGYSDVRTLHDDLGVVYSRLMGEAWDLGAGYAVARMARPIGSPLGFLNSADDKDKRTVPLLMIILISVLVAGIGLALSFLEHTRPLRVFRDEAQLFGKGKVEQLTASKFGGVYRQIAASLNEGMEHVAAKGGAPRRAADLDAVLGPMPAQPSMSAFSLPQSSIASPLDRVQAPVAPPPAPARPSPAAAAPAPQPFAPPAASSFGQAAAAPPAPPPRAPGPAPMAAQASAAAAAAPAPAAPRAPVRPPPAKQPSLTLVGVAPAAPAPTPAGTPPMKAALAAGKAPMAAPAFSPFAPTPAAPPAMGFERPEDADEATVVSHVSSEILGQLSADRGTDRPPPIHDETAEWRRVYDEFLRLKKECGETTDGLNFEKFKSTLRKNRDQLLQRHGCKSVKFSVYLKEGKAALKANPIRE